MTTTETTPAGPRPAPTAPPVGAGRERQGQIYRAGVLGRRHAVRLLLAGVQPDGGAGADTTTLGWRPQDLDLGSLPCARGRGIAQYSSDPRFREVVRQRVADVAAAGTPAEAVEVTLGAVRGLLSITASYPGRFVDNLRSKEPRAAVETFLDIYSNPGLSWDHLATLRGRTSLPILLKGILHPDDAARALEAGVDLLVGS